MPTAIVTGGSRGIGLAISRELAARGFDLALGARTESELATARDGIVRKFQVRCSTWRTDVSRADEAQALVDRAAGEFGRINALVNNAGVIGAIGKLQDCDLDEWRHAIDVNLLGTVNMARAVIPHMRRQGGGRIVNMAGAGIGGSGVAPCVSAYAASKAAVVQFTESIARELASESIFVNVISPGGVVTDITEAILAAGADKAGRALYSRTLEQRQRGGEPPEQAARLVAWLLSPAAKDLTGKMLSAKWDDISRIDPDAANRSSLYNLRRIDDVLFSEVRGK